jgi:cohesin complex subunit SA-1/2
MDQMLALAKVEMSPTSKLWEPQRVYEKKLGMSSKDKSEQPPPLTVT